MDINEYGDLILRAGRVPFKVKFGEDYDAEHQELQEEILNDDVSTGRVPVRDVTKGNAWSSYAKLDFKFNPDDFYCRAGLGTHRDDVVHLPVFDVDHMPDKLTAEGSTYEAAVRKLFPKGDITWVPSTTEGHHHVYVEWPMLWGDYKGALTQMVTLGIVQDGYKGASFTKGATYVRMQHVKKPDLILGAWGPPAPLKSRRLEWCTCEREEAGGVLPWFDSIRKASYDEASHKWWLHSDECWNKQWEQWDDDPF